MYDSVSGTEADLEWVREHTNDPSSRLAEGGKEFGRQYVTFNEWQAYPEIRVRLRLKRVNEVTQMTTPAIRWPESE